MATKAAIATGVSSASVAAGTGANTVVSNTIDLSVQDAALVTVQITNGATAPTLGCTVQVMHSTDGGTTFNIIDSATAGVTASTAYAFRWTYGPELLLVRLWFGQNTGQAVTASAQCAAVAAL